MIKNLAFKIVKYRVKSYLPLITPKYYSKMFTLGYKFFVFFKTFSIISSNSGFIK